MNNILLDYSERYWIYLQNRIHISYICYHTTFSFGTQDLAVLFLPALLVKPSTD